jgi:hypothetical protein
MDEKIKQAMIDGVLDGARIVMAEKFREMHEEGLTTDDKEGLLDWMQDYVADSAKMMLELVERVGKADE